MCGGKKGQLPSNNFDYIIGQDLLHSRSIIFLLHYRSRFVTVSVKHFVTVSVVFYYTIGDCYTIGKGRVTLSVVVTLSVSVTLSVATALRITGKVLITVQSDVSVS